MVQFVYETGTGQTEYELRVHHASATVGDLAARLGASGPLEVDGRRVGPDIPLRLAAIRAGSTLRPAAAGGARWPAGATTLTVVAGLAAGESVPLPPGESLIGRAQDARLRIDLPRVSRRHCLLRIGQDNAATVTDLGSVNGTDVDGVRIDASAPVGAGSLVNLGGAALLRLNPVTEAELNARDEPRYPSGQGDAAAAERVPFSRPPRAPLPPAAAPRPAVAREERETTRIAAFSIAQLLTPLLLGAAAFLIFRQISFLLFTALTPVMLLGNLTEEHWRDRRATRRSAAARRSAVDQFTAEIAGLRAAEIRRRHHLHPDLATHTAQAEGPGPRLWERRPGDEDFLIAAVGLGPGQWPLPVEVDRGARIDPVLAERLAPLAHLDDVPVEVRLGPGHGVAVNGDRDAVTAVARGLLAQAAVSCGPSDLTVAVFTDPQRADQWTWTSWLPHLIDWQADGGLLSAHAPDAIDALARDLAGRTTPGALLAVVDGAALLEGRACPLRDLLTAPDGAVSAIVITGRTPALCDQVVSVTADGKAVLDRIDVGERVSPLMASGMTEPGARRLARALARHEDPELRTADAGIPAAVTLLSLLGLEDVTTEAIRARWTDGRRTRRLSAVLGLAATGPLTIDLDQDGPHGLIAGTTGSGKSEFLRTLIAGLALDADPEHLNLVLVDFKGGGALDECADLPHTVGLVTDLDEQLAARALRCLQAELRHREHALRAVGLGHVTEYQALRSGGRDDLDPLPRLVVVIDEFATLAKALPGFVDALVSVAQRGRSLGVHLIMATQRPAGSVSDAIKNNVRLRVALRLESAGDSLDVVDSPAAASIGPRQVGRACLRTGPGRVEPFQVALCSAPSALRTSSALTLLPLRGGRAAVPLPPPENHSDTDLRRIVGAAADAYHGDPPRAVWPEPLPHQVDLAGLTAATGLQTDAAGLAPLALADDPDRQRQYPVGWDPDAGNLLIYGSSRADTAAALAALLLGLAAGHAPGDLHLHLLDFGTGALAGLRTLPHVGAHVGAADSERQIRTLRLYAAEVRRRTVEGHDGAPRWLLAVENLAALTAEFDKDPTRAPLLDELDRIHADGPALGIFIAATVDRAGAAPYAWTGRTAQKILLSLAEAGDYGYFSVPHAAVPASRRGRGLIAANHREIQLGHPGDDLAVAARQAAERWDGCQRTAVSVAALPRVVPYATLGAAAERDGPLLLLPVGLRCSTLEPCSVTLHEHEHILVAGPARSGRSQALCLFATALLDAGGTPVIAYAPRRSPLRDLPAPAVLVTDDDELATALSEAPTGPLTLLVDDAETVDDALGHIGALLDAGRGDVHVITAVRNNAARRLFGHWTQKVRASRRGVLLMPDWSDDGDLLGTTLPRNEPFARSPGRGYLVADDTLMAIHLAITGSERT